MTIQIPVIFLNVLNDSYGINKMHIFYKQVNFSLLKKTQQRSMKIWEWAILGCYEQDFGSAFWRVSLLWSKEVRRSAQGGSCVNVLHQSSGWWELKKKMKSAAGREQLFLLFLLLMLMLMPKIDSKFPRYFIAFLTFECLTSSNYTNNF